MRSLQPKAEDTPPDDDDPGDPPSTRSVDALDQPQPEIEPTPMIHPARNAEADFRGEKRSNATHASTTDPDARL